MRLPTHLEVSALVRRVEGEGGFATVLARGDRDSGTLLVVLNDRGSLSTAYERMPQADGTRRWSVSRQQDANAPFTFGEYLERRKDQDSDLWIVELDVRDGERFIEELAQG
ncbi:DUF1491 family protein [Novosphingobium sp. 9U]|uniref:DUF1491 family protein n=1 Tax=Novosphingobium sp. 9U TaxID=2653158 RepID=UPI0012F3FBCC|nr:DUF1491 family protein [Novosphingobium sp. 9U]VWX53715.1 conserved hypothetical protein [Novosphingobium sp. 9U]